MINDAIMTNGIFQNNYNETFTLITLKTGTQKSEQCQPRSDLSRVTDPATRVSLFVILSTALVKGYSEHIFFLLLQQNMVQTNLVSHTKKDYLIIMGKK